MVDVEGEKHRNKKELLFHLKDSLHKNLKDLYKQAIDDILEDPSIGEDKHGDLEGIKGYDIYYNKTNYGLP